MERNPFQFKRFAVRDENCAMKLSTDPVLLGAFIRLKGATRVLDIGTGCGILALMAAQTSDAEITAIDPDPGCVKDARYNFEFSPWKHRFSLHQKSLQEFAFDCRVQYDHILSNPPFFSGSLLSPDQRKNNSRHDRLLPLSELFRITKALLSRSGKFSVILPFGSGVSAHTQAAAVGLNMTRKMVIRPVPGKSANRLLMEYQAKSGMALEEKELLIRDKNGQYTPEYRSFTKDFYLHF